MGNVYNPLIIIVGTFVLGAPGNMNYGAGIDGLRNFGTQHLQRPGTIVDDSRLGKLGNYVVGTRGRLRSFGKELRTPGTYLDGTPISSLGLFQGARGRC